MAANPPPPLKLAASYRLPCLCIDQSPGYNLPRVTKFEWLRELYVDYPHDDRLARKIAATIAPYAELAISHLPPGLVVLRCKYLCLNEMPVLPESLEMLLWAEHKQVQWKPDRRLDGPLPRTLRS